MSFLFRIALLLTLYVALTGQASATLLFSASLDGSQEVPPNASTASGQASLSLNDAQTRLTMSIQTFVLDLDGNQTPGNSADDVTGMHIHIGIPGTNGPIVFGLINPNNDLNNDLVIDAVAGTVQSAWDLNEGQGGLTLSDMLSPLMGGQLYFNVHTLAFPGGEIRGQILAQVPEPAILGLFGLGLLAIAGIVRKGRGKVLEA